MTFLPRAIALLASLLIVLLTIACESPAGSSGPGTTTVRGSHPSAKADAGYETKARRSYDAGDSGDCTSSSVSEATPTEASSVAATVPEPVESSFGAGSVGGADGAREANDPFAVIGPAFSGMGFQSYSSGCDPFEDKYGTCL